MMIYWDDSHEEMELEDLQDLLARDESIVLDYDSDFWEVVV
jgi:hypothetical protein